jgi:hypothetical protein
MKRLLLILTLASFPASAPACPMCKDSIANKEGTTDLKDAYSASGQNISAGMNYSVYAMLGVLFGTIGLVSTVIVRGIRSSDRAARQRERDGHEDR